MQGSGVLSSPWIFQSRRVLQPPHLKQDREKEIVTRVQPKELVTRKRSFRTKNQGPSPWHVPAPGSTLSAEAGTACWPCPPPPRVMQTCGAERHHYYLQRHSDPGTPLSYSVWAAPPLRLPEQIKDPPKEMPPRFPRLHGEALPLPPQPPRKLVPCVRVPDPPLQHSEHCPGWSEAFEHRCSLHSKQLDSFSLASLVLQFYSGMNAFC